MAIAVENFPYPSLHMDRERDNILSNDIYASTLRNFGQRVTTTCYKGDSGNEEDIKRAEDVEERACRNF